MTVPPSTIVTIFVDAIENRWRVRPIEEHLPQELRLPYQLGKELLKTLEEIGEVTSNEPN